MYVELELILLVNVCLPYFYVCCSHLCVMYVDLKHIFMFVGLYHIFIHVDFVYVFCMLNWNLFYPYKPRVLFLDIGKQCKTRSDAAKCGV